jgi:hypothetical protein
MFWLDGFNLTIRLIPETTDSLGFFICFSAVAVNARN